LNIVQQILKKDIVYLGEWLPAVRRLLCDTWYNEPESYYGMPEGGVKMSRVIELYDYLHTIPELGMQEEKTSEFLAEQLEKAGYAVSRHVGGATGVVGVYHTGVPGPVLALRADMDALGHKIDGVFCARHTCGHDGHSSMVLTAAERLIQPGELRRGTLKILFQPAEELGTGAVSLLQGGALDDVDMVLGLHVRPKEEAKMGEATPALYHAASQRLKAIIHGTRAHGARPHLGVNAIDAAALSIMAVNTIRMNPNVSYNIKATQFECNSGVTNAIPDEAVVIWDVRAELNDTMDALLPKAKRAIIGACESMGATADVAWYGLVPAAEYSDDATALLSEAIVAVLGTKGLLPPEKTAGGEDFHNFIRQKPGLHAGYFGLGCDLEPGLHHPDMHFNIAALESGVDILCYAAKKYLG